MRENFENIIFKLSINEIERFFEITILPTGPIKLDECSNITDVSLFIKSHLDILKFQRDNLRYKPYLDRLIELKQVITQKLK